MSTMSLLFVNCVSNFSTPAKNFPTCILYRQSTPRSRYIGWSKGISVKEARACRVQTIATTVMKDKGHDENRSQQETLSSEKEHVERVTMEWVREFVIGLNLCPFAEEVLRNRAHRVIVDDNVTTPSAVWPLVRREIDFLMQTPAEEVETTLVVMPKFAVTDFLEFHDFCTWMEEVIEKDENLVDEVMLACFHPQHQWGDAQTTRDPINFDKRSPFPIVNILRAVHVDQYVEEGRTQGILERNNHTLENLGSDEVNRKFDALYNEA